MVRFAFALVGAVQPALSHTISEYVQLICVALVSIHADQELRGERERMCYWFDSGLGH